MRYEILALLLMYALHIFADFHLQGILANLKQKDWWNKQLETYSPHEKKFYSHDYLVGLIVHSFEWTFFFMIPVFFVESNILYIVIAFVLNLTVHAIVDGLKCNLRIINLVHDQTPHTIQILITWIIFFCMR